MRGKETEMIIQQHKEGKFVTNYTSLKINLHGMPFKVKRIELDNEVVTFDKVNFDGKSTLTIDKEFSELRIIGA